MRILVVEDVPAFANAIAEGLRDQGMAVDVAYDGHEAATKLDLTAYEVVVLDRDKQGGHLELLAAEPVEDAGSARHSRKSAGNGNENVSLISAKRRGLTYASSGID